MRGSLAEACAKGRGKALIVDGDPESLWFMAQALHLFSPGFDVATARSVPQALEWLGTFHPRVLILDARMESEAAGLVARLRAIAGQAARPILLLIEESGAIAGGSSSELNPSGILHRPVRLRDLLGAVRGDLPSPSVVGRTSMRVA